MLWRHVRGADAIFTCETTPSQAAWQPTRTSRSYPRNEHVGGQQYCLSNGMSAGYMSMAMTIWS